MFSQKVKYITSLFIFFLLVTPAYSQNTLEDQNKETIEKGIQLLQKYFIKENNWSVTSSEMGKTVQGLIHFIEDEPVDSVLKTLNKSSNDITFNFVYRLPENVSDSLKVPGYYQFASTEKDIEKIGLNLQKEFQERQIPLPRELITDIEGKVNIIQPGEGMKLFADSVYTLPDSLQNLDVIPDTLIQTADDFQRILKLDSIRVSFIELKRLAYNDSIVKSYRDSVIFIYRQEQFEKEYNFRKKDFIDSVTLNNYLVLKNYNDSIVRAVNDSISFVIQSLADYANYIDTTRLKVSNLTNDASEIVLRNQGQHFTRVWLKNEQNDSLSVLIRNVDKRSIQMLIDDGITFSRFTPQKTKDFDFNSLNEKVLGLEKFGKQYEVETPWRIGGDGSAGFTQTYLENWKKGGKSALSLLIVLKGFANYSRADGKIKWENTGEIRNGWIRPGGAESELQKNDDKFEITSRFGVSAFKKWYYSAELNYNTQFFNGYRYPTSENPDPFSAFMAPARTFFKVGLDYKPNKNFSLFLSPLTIKNVYVKDTVTIDQTKFGVDADRRSFWEPGLNADLKFRKEITPDISYETKYKMFFNYKEPFRKFDINWENLLIMQLTEYINMRMMVHLIYDDDVLFPVYDINEIQIGEKPKLQIKQFITIGFSYKINRQVTRTKRVR